MWLLLSGILFYELLLQKKKYTQFNKTAVDLHLLQMCYAEKTSGSHREHSGNAIKSLMAMRKWNLSHSLVCRSSDVLKNRKKGLINPYDEDDNKNSNNISDWYEVSGWGTYWRDIFFCEVFVPWSGTFVSIPLSLVSTYFETYSEVITVSLC